jgi:ubiquinone/menaquinone biosynthesis C-methylase UbiE
MESDDNEIQNKYNSLGDRIYDLMYKDEQILKYNIVLSNISFEEFDLFLDHGCGTGLFMNIIENPIVGIDQSYILLKGAMRRTKGKETKHLVQGNTNYLPFRNNVFQKSFSFTVIQNISNPLMTLSEIKRVTNDLKILTILKKSHIKKKIISLVKKVELRMYKIINRKDVNDYLLIIK